MISLPTVPLMLDTDVLIEIGKPTVNAAAWIATLSQVPHVCGFAALEYLHGARDYREFLELQKFVQTFPLVWPQEQDLQRVLITYMKLPLSVGIGLFDLLIATTAIAAGMKLMTFNVKHFRHVPGLDFGAPYTL